MSTTLVSAEGGPTMITTNLVGLVTSQCDLKIWGLWRRTKIIIGVGAKFAVHAKIKQDSAPFGSFLANGFGIPKFQQKILSNQ